MLFKRPGFGYSVSMSPAILLSYLYFLQGLPYGLQARFLPIYFRAHGMSLSNIGFIKVLFFPWMCKTLWAPFVDRLGNKKTWLSWSMLGLAVTCILAAGIQPDWLLPLSLILLTFNLLTSTQDIATDGLAIEILTSSEVANGNIAQVVGYKMGAIIGGGLLAWLSDHITWTAIFIFLTLTYATALVMVKVFVPEGKNCGVETTLEFSAPSDSEFQVNRPNGHDPDKDIPADDSLPDNLDSPSVNTRSKSTKTKYTRSAAHSNTQVKTSFKGDISIVHPEATDENAVNKEVQSSPHSDCRSASLKDNTGSGYGGVSWIKNHFADVLTAEGTLWILVYVLIYKLGEQGALNMMPMFLMDGGVPTGKVGLWTGVVGQAVSIIGSVAGGAAITSGRYTALKFLQLLSVVKVVVLAAETAMVTATSGRLETLGSDTVACITLMLLLLMVSGAVSTAAFTLMMQCSQRARPHCRASHYSLLATAEVLGKLVFSVFVGAITDLVGYSLAFSLFLTLSLVVLPLFWYAPKSRSPTDTCLNQEGSECNKRC